MAKPPPIEFPEIEDELPATTGAPTTDVAIAIDAPAGADAAPSVEDGVAELKAQLAEQRAQNERERDARIRAEQQVSASQGETRDSHLIAVTNSIALTQQELDNTEAAHAAAMEGGDFKAAAKLQREMVSKQSKLDQLENGRVALEESIARGGQRQVVTEGRVEQRQPQREPTTQERVDGLASQLERSGGAASAQWLRAHPDIMATQASRERLAASHEYAVKVKGIQPDTQAYFQSIETDLGMRAAPAPASAPRRQAMVAAPVNREVAPTISGAAGGGRVVNLSPRQQQAAADMGMTNKEYAQYLYEDQQERGMTH